MRDFSARASTSFAEGALHLFIVNASKEKEKGRTNWNFSLFFLLGPRDDFAPSDPAFFRVEGGGGNQKKLFRKFEHLKYWFFC